MKTKLKQKDILFPAPAALVVTGDQDDTNIITVAWIGIMSSRPPALAISLKSSRYSLEKIKNAKEFTVNIPKSSMYKEADYCGIRSGKNVDKFEATGFTKSKSHSVNAPGIEECPFTLECVLIEEKLVGEWTMMIAEIKEALLDESCIDDEGNINTEDIDPLIYIPTIREYWTLGTKLGNSFEVGRSIAD